MKKYFYEYKDKEYESDDPLEVASVILELSEEDEKLKLKLLEMIADKLVNEIEEDNQYTTPYEEAFNRQFDDALDKLKDL